MCLCPRGLPRIRPKPRRRQVVTSFSASPSLSGRSASPSVLLPHPPSIFRGRSLLQMMECQKKEREMDRGGEGRMREKQRDRQMDGGGSLDHQM